MSGITDQPGSSTKQGPPQPKGKSLLTTDGLSIGYGGKGPKKSLGLSLNLSLTGGQLICLLGANGAGKTTLMRTLASMQPPLSGSIQLENQPISAYPRKSLAKKMALVLTEMIPTGNLSVYSLLSLGRYPYLSWLGLLSPYDKRSIKQAVGATGIARFLAEPIHHLSDGERQKVMIARAMVQETPIILLDEPTAHLDLPNRLEIIQLLRKMSHDGGKAILFSTHELDLAMQAADQVWLMMPDKTVHVGTPEDLVLDGSFEKAFARPGVSFSKETGGFKIEPPKKNQAVQLNGQGIAFEWTKRALERQGFALKDAANWRISVEEHTKTWKVQGASRPIICQSIGELLQCLSDHAI